MSSPVTGTAAGVPYVAVPPLRADRENAPLVVAWHLMDPPRTPAAFQAAIPLDGLDAWRVYLTLPMFGERMRAGGMDEIFGLMGEDAVLKFYGPVELDAAAEFPAALADLQSQLAIMSTSLGLMGGSAGGAVVQTLLAEADLDVRAAVLISPVVRLRDLIDSFEQITYQWSPESDAVAARLDFVARAGEIARRRPGLPIRTIAGADDEACMLDPIREQEAAFAGLAASGTPIRADLQILDGMGHGVADEPGIEPAPQNTDAVRVDALATEWFREHLQ
jgi:pimeloyl-ACP methyl ester carboxylesterase